MVAYGAFYTYNSLKSALAAQGNTANRPLQNARSALAGRHYDRFRVMVGGDSMAEGQGAQIQSERWQKRLQDVLRSRFQTVGLGATGGEGHYKASYQLTGPSGGTAFVDGWTPTGSISYTDATYGLGRKSAIMQPGATMTRLVTASAIDIHYLQATGTGHLVVKRNGATELDLDTNNPASFIDGRTVRYTPSTVGSFTLQIACTGAQAVLEGVTVYNGDSTKGITVYDDAVYGSRTSDWIFSGDDRRNFNRLSINQIQPHLYVMCLGANDAIQNVAPGTIKANLLTRISDINAACSIPPSIIGVVPYRAALISDTNAASLLLLWNEIAAAASNVTVLNLADYMPNVEGDVLGLYDLDATHMKPKGQSVVAELVADMLSSPV